MAPNISAAENIFLVSEESRFGVVNRGEMNRVSGAPEPAGCRFRFGSHRGPPEHRRAAAD